MKLYAFWPHNCHPPHNLLGGEVTEIHDDGTVAIEGFDGYSFSPIKIMNLKAGKELKSKLDDLERRYNAESKVLRNKFNQEFKANFGKIFDWFWLINTWFGVFGLTATQFWLTWIKIKSTIKLWTH